ncbi:Ig-like domain-containing protein [Deinococcus humi]|uniref:Right handed beta helix domain-containing protein n=1 Tax=Deinococcus humi TaxID=662880 RepID=A0A7W8JT37_9DEIO|nr:Ig-like domain-containing protein [Deinococcus humi]MBB5361316.1 hypothetical protein [Deinococcus humi]GGO19449.1 hypothetical protein GCM10008949_03810 [Deinococcus humi]
MPQNQNNNLRARLAEIFAELLALLDGHAPPDTTPPTVNLTASNTTFTAPGAFDLIATAAGGTIARVEYYKDGEKIGEQFTPVNGVYTFPVEVKTSAAAGSYTAKAFTLFAYSPPSEPLVVTVDIAPVIPADTTAPTLTLTVSPNPVTAEGKALLTATPADNVGVASVTFRRTAPSAMTLGTVTAAPWTWEDDTPLTTAMNGTRSYEAFATDAAGNVSATATAGTTVAIPIPPDVTPPTVALSMPNHPSTTVSTAESILFRANAADNVAIKYVIFYWNGVEFARKTTAPYETTPSFTSANNGAVKITARAFDTSDNQLSDSINLTVSIAGATPTDPAKYVEPEYSAITWGAPITINDAYLTAKGITPIASGPDAGRYLVIPDHNARTLTTGECAIAINTTKPLILQYATVSIPAGGGTGRGAIGNGKVGSVNSTVAVDVIIRDCSILTPGMDLPDGKRAGGIKFEYAKNVIVENCNFNGTGIYVSESGTGGGTVKALRNKFKNIDGRYRDRSTGTGWSDLPGDQAWYRVQAVQLNKISGIAGIEIKDNWVHNEPGVSQVEDVFNTYKSGGTAASYLTIERNLVNGAWDARNKSHSGSATVMGDAGGSRTRVINNTYVRTTNTGASMSSMNYGEILNNRIGQTGFLPDGVTRVESDGTVDTGIYARNYVSGFTMDKTTNLVGGNLVAWGAPLSGDLTRRKDFGFSTYATEGPTPNVSYDGVVTEALLDQWVADHLAVWQSAGVVVGRRNP